jgi:phospholipid/cholesterol/gamma-HCH transport system permease protein
MNRFLAKFESLGDALILAVRSFASLPSAPRIIKRTAEHGYYSSYTSLPIVAILSLFIGSVLALQAGISMKDFGAKQFIGTLVGESMARELGPVMVAIILAGRVGSAVTAELASMKVYNEIDALVTMNIPPHRLLVLPRLLAILFLMPVLTIIGVIIGWLGGMLVCQTEPFIGLEPEAYWQSLKHFLTVKKMMGGLIKAEIFGFAVMLIACNTGLRTRGGPREIGFAVTKSVVTSLVAILILDYFITRILA